MTERSWWEVAPEPPEHRLPDDLRALDPFAARDCGWVTQMRPFVRAYSRPGECVFDPFCGFGTTLLAAALEGRRALGMEVEPARAALARERLRRHAVQADVVCGSLPETALPAPIGLCLTSVPYFGCGWGVPADDAGSGRQLYRAEHFAGYLEAMRDVFHAVRDALPEGGYCIAMVENARIGAHTVPQAWELAGMLCTLFEPCEERVLVYPPRGASSAPPGDGTDSIFTDRTHEYALVFRKHRRAVDVAEARALLGALEDAGFAFSVHGSFAAWRHGDQPLPSRPPTDVDLCVADDPDRLRALLQTLQTLGFRLWLWDRPVMADVHPDTVRRHHYLRAERLHADGRRLRLDIAIADDGSSLTP